MKMKFEKRAFPLKAPFVITGYTFETSETVRVTLENKGCVGHGEGIGVYYNNETTDSIVAQLESVVGNIEIGFSREDAQRLLPAGGARNALDCAFWDLETKLAGKTIWELLEMAPRRLTSVYTIGIGSPKAMGEAAGQATRYARLKIKLGNEDPIARLEAVREARPDATLIVDVNQGWNFEELKEYIPAAERLGIAMIEQPLPRGADEELEDFKSPVPLGADESCLDTAEYDSAARRYDVINIKLDKCGGLTEGLKLAEMARHDNKTLMIGNMTGSSLSMAPAYVIGQYCQFIDIDGPLLLAHDVENGLSYGAGGVVDVPDPKLWG